MQKEKLTLQHIQKDVNSGKKEHIIRAILFSLLLIALVFSFIFGFRMAPADFLDELPLVLIGGGILLYRIIHHVLYITVRYRSASLPDRIVKDTLINAEYIDRYQLSLFPRRYLFHFARCGKYIVPEKNYTWSAAFSMSDEGVFNYAVNGDAFYLVLSKPHAGKILCAYNAKLFELEE